MLTIGGSGIKAFAGINGGSADRLGLALDGVEFGLALMTSKADAKRSWTSLQANAGSVAFVGVNDLTISATDIAVNVNQAGKAGDAVVNYASGATALAVNTGAGSTLALSLDGAKGELVQATGHLKIDLFGFIQIEGDLAIETSSSTVTLAKASGKNTAEEVKVDVLTVGGSKINAFVGVNGGTDDAIGLSLNDIDFGLAMFTSQADKSRHWTALHASAASVGFVGLSDLLPTVRNLSVDVNQASLDKDQVIDFAGAHAFTVATGTGSSIALTMSGAAGELVRAEGDLTLRLFDFAYLSGRIGFESYTPSSDLTLANGKKAKASSMLAITGQGIDAFVGYADGGIDSSKTFEQQRDNLYGFGIQNLDFGLLLTKAGGQSYTALKAHADTFALYGFDPNVFELSATGLSMEINKGPSGGSTIDYAKSFGASGLALGSNGKVVMDLAGGERIGVFAENATLAISDFLYFSGAIGFQKADFGDTFKNSKGATVVGAKGFSIGGSNITAFVGYADGGIDRSKTLAAQADHLYGFGVDSLDFAYLSVKDKAGREYSALKAHADSVALYGFNPNDFELSAKDLTIEYNSASAGAAALDFSGSRNLAVPTGGTPVTLDFKGDRLGVYAGNATLAISDFLYFSGAIGFQKADFGDTFKNSKGATVVGAKGFSIGGSNITAFVGYADGGIDRSKTLAAQADHLYGFGVDSLDFAYLSVKDKAGREYSALKAHADSVALYGFNPNDFELSAKDLTIEYNSASAGAAALDFSGSRNLAVPTGGTPVTLDFKGDRLGVYAGNATLSISSFMYFSGSIGFEKADYGNTLVNSAGSKVVGATGFSIGGSNITAFVGYADGGIDRTKTLAQQADRLYGFGIDDLDFGYLSVKDKAGRSYGSLKANAALVAIEALVNSKNSAAVNRKNSKGERVAALACLAI